MTNRLETCGEKILGYVGDVKCYGCGEHIIVPVIKETRSRWTICGTKRSYATVPNFPCPHCHTIIHEIHNVLPRHFVK